MSTRLLTRRGVALLDAIVALFLLSSIAAAALALTSASARQLGVAEASEREFQEANAFIHAVALWDRATLDQRLGTRRQSPWWLHIERPRLGLYTIALLDSARTRTILHTALYRGAEKQP